MKWLVFALGAVLLAAGLGSLYFSLDLGGLERGTALTISGAIYLTGGLLLFGLGCVVSAIERATALMKSAPPLPATVTVQREDWRSEPRPAEMVSPVQPPAPVTDAAKDPAVVDFLPSAGSSGAAAGAAAVTAAAYSSQTETPAPALDAIKAPVKADSPAPAPLTEAGPVLEPAIDLPGAPQAEQRSATPAASWRDSLKRFKARPAPAAEAELSRPESEILLQDPQQSDVPVAEAAQEVAQADTPEAAAETSMEAAPRKERPRIDFAKLKEDLAPPAPTAPSSSGFLSALRKPVMPVVLPAGTGAANPAPIADDPPATPPTEQNERSSGIPPAVQAPLLESETREDAAPAADKAAHDSQEETPPRAAVAPPEPGPAQVRPAHASIVGRYKSGGINYVLYSDGSIEADTGRETFHFANMMELKAFIERRPQEAEAS